MEKFKFWCFKVLPLVYDDSLSYYEVLCKLKAKVNEIVEQLNSGYESAIEDAVQAYINTDDFKNYVEGYIGDFIESEAFEPYVRTIIESYAKGFVHIDDYGAVGDGETDDSGAIADAAEVANELGLPLVADGTKRYLVTMDGFQPETGRWRGIPINTNVNFNGATIVIDWNLADGNPQNLFEIMHPSTVEYTNIGSAAIGKYATNDSRFYNKVLDIKSPLSFGRRWGTGDYMYHEQVLATSPRGIYINDIYYPEIISGAYTITATDFDIAPIVIENIVFEIVDGAKASYLTSGRPHVTFKNLAFKGYTSANNDWSSCIRILGTYNNNIIDCVGAAPFNRKLDGNSAGYTYEIRGANITVKNVYGEQANSNVYPSFGIGFVENYSWENVEAYRWDSHYEMMGNISIKNCVVSGVNTSGGWGNFIMENCTIRNQDRNEAVIRRDDVQLPFSGNMAFRNINFYGRIDGGTCRPFKFTIGDVIPTLSNINYTGTSYLFENINSPYFTGWEWVCFEFGESHYCAEKTNVVIKNCVINSYDPNASDRATTIKVTGGAVNGEYPIMKSLIFENVNVINPSGVVFNCRAKKVIMDKCSLGNIYFAHEVAPYSTGSFIILSSYLDNISSITNIDADDDDVLIIKGCVFGLNNPVGSYSNYSHVIIDNNIVATDDKTGQEDINGILV